VDLEGRSTDFLDWAEHYVEQLDPLSSISHDPVLTPARSYFPGGDGDRLQAELRRLLGHSWHLAQKI
jgi:hypothetical protein